MLDRKYIRNANGLTEEEFLASYKVGDYERPSNTVDIVLFRTEVYKSKVMKESSVVDLKILLIRRKDHPYINCLAIPGGFCNKNEDMEVSARRELMEETNVENCFMEPVKAYSAPGRDPRTWVVSHSYLAVVPPENSKVEAGDDAADAKWFSIKRESLNENEIVTTVYNDETGEKAILSQKKTYRMNGKIKEEIYSIPEYLEGSNFEFAFDHDVIITDALKRLTERVSDVSFLRAMLPEKFSLTSMQSVVETVSGQTLVKQNFRTKVIPYLELTDEKEEINGYRPAALYKYK